MKESYSGLHGEMVTITKAEYERLKALQSPSSAKDTPVQVVNVIQRSVEDGYMVRRGEPFHYTLVAYCHNLHEANEIAELLKSSPVSVDIDTELLKHVAIAFFYWWYNAKGSNTSQGFDEWIKLPSTMKAIQEASKASPPKQNEK
jgi:hypothetical protein